MKSPAAADQIGGLEVAGCASLAPFSSPVAATATLSTDVYCSEHMSGSIPPFILGNDKSVINRHPEALLDALQGELHEGMILNAPGLRAMSANLALNWELIPLSSGFQA